MGAVVIPLPLLFEQHIGAARAKPALAEFRQKTMSDAHTAVVVSSSRPKWLRKNRKLTASRVQHVRN